MKDFPEENTYAAVQKTLANRCTTKAMADTPWPSDHSKPEKIQQILEAAGEAPFHKPVAKDHRNGHLTGLQPWRCYHLDASQCRKLRQHLIDHGDLTKIPKMLAVADYLIQVTWLPNPSADSSDKLFDPSIQNMEHIAAASAAIQNMLLAATAKGIPNYWSSGGELRAPEAFSLLGIPAPEILLGAIFLFPKDVSRASTSPGALRNSRSPIVTWSRAVAL